MKFYHKSLRFLITDKITISYICNFWILNKFILFFIQIHSIVTIVISLIIQILCEFVHLLN